MKKYLSLCCVFGLAGLLLRTEAQNGVVPAYFYYLKQPISGKQRCNCAPNFQCGPDGTCPDQDCNQMYVGPRCQHAAISWFCRTAFDIQEEHEVCFAGPITFTAGYALSIHIPIHFIWIYISARSVISVNPKLELSNCTDCPVKGGQLSVYYLKLNDKELLIKQRQDVSFKSLTLFNVPQDILSLKMSIGRNLAISSSPDQSSVSQSERSTAVDALKAIDGSDNPRYSDDSCTHTVWPMDPLSKFTWWETHLKYDALVNMVYIINRDDNQCRLMYLILETFESNGDQVFRYEDETNVTKAHYTVWGTNEKLIKKVRVTIDPSLNTNCNSYGVLTICELYIFGEFRCPDNWYGPLCERECPNGCSREKCDPDWGCPQGCNEGWTGHWCETKFNSTIQVSTPRTDSPRRTLTCTASPGLGRGNFSTTFYKDGSLVSVLENSGESDNSLFLPKPTKSDSGSYTCRFEGNGLTSTMIPVEINFIDDAHHQLFDPETVMEGDSATLTCDVRKVANYASDDIVESLMVSKKAASNRPADFEWMVDYNASRMYDREEQWTAPWVTELKSSGRMTLSFDGMSLRGSQPEGNAATMRVVMKFNKVLCKDSAIYRCQAAKQLPNNGLTKTKMDGTLKVIGRVKDITQQTRPEKKLYHEEDTITIMCLTFGPVNVSIRWKYQTCPTGSVQNTPSLDWQPVSDITNTNEGTIRSDGCTYTRFKSVLSNAKLSTGDRTICQIQCVAGVVGLDGGSFVEHRQWSKTITYVTPSSSKNIFSALTWDLLTILGVICALLLLGSLVGVYGRLKRRQLAEEEEPYEIDQVPESDVTITTVKIPHKTDLVEPDVPSPTTDGVIGVTSPTTDGVNGVTSPTTDGVIGVISPTTDGLNGVTSPANDGVIGVISLTNDGVNGVASPESDSVINVTSPANSDVTEV